MVLLLPVVAEDELIELSTPLLFRTILGAELDVTGEKAFAFLILIMLPATETSGLLV